MKEPPDPPYRCVKTSLKSVVKNNLVIEKLTDAALRVNGIMIHTLQLLQLYLLDCCEKGDELPTLDRQFVTSVIKRQHHRFTEPVKGKGFRTMFRKAGYDVYLVDEFRTSCRCSACEQSECTTFRICENPRPYMSGSILRHGLVRCKSCSKLWNRDTNTASNIWKVATSAIRGEGRLAYLRRARGPISGATSAGNEVPGCLATLPRNHDLALCG